MPETPKELQESINELQRKCDEELTDLKDKYKFSLESEEVPIYGASSTTTFTTVRMLF